MFIHSYQAATSMLIYVNLIKRIPHYMTLNCFGIFLSCKVLFETTPIENWTQTSILPATLPAIRSKHLLWALIHISSYISSSFNLGWMWYPKTTPVQSAHSATSRGKMFSCRFAGHGTRVDSFKRRWKPCFFFMVYPVYCPVIQHS